MTNKEAIEILSNRLNTYYCTDEDLQAIDLAIKALEERPKGAWVCFQVMNSFSQLESKFKCPFCKREFYSNYDFCVCGADMRGGKGE